MDAVKIDMDTYIDMLYDRYNDIWHGDDSGCPQCIFDYAMEIIRDCGGDEENPEHNSPSYVVDNIVVNGDYCPLSEAIKDGETEEEALDRLEDDCMAIVGDDDDKWVIYSL